MLGELIDKAVAVFAPATAARRAYARGVYRRVSKRAYDAAKRDRTNSSWRTSNQSADRALSGEADVVRQRARDLIRNNAYARGALDAIVANVIGCGITPRPALEDDARNAAILKAWNKWCEESDVTGRLHFYEMQALALREMVESGECLMHYMADDSPRRRSPFCLEMVEADRIASETDTFIRRGNQNSNNEIRRGVELDRKGKAVAYWLYPSHPDGTQYMYPSPERIEAEKLLHIYRQERIGQTRGVSWLAPAVMWLRDLGMYVDNELQASAVASCLTAVIKTVDGGASWGGLAASAGESSADTAGNRFEHFEPGQVAHLMPGEDIEIINPARPNANADAWISLILRSIAVAMGVSYELVSRDYSRTNYSSNRASALEDRRRFRPVQRFFIWHVCQPVYRQFFEWGVQASEAGRPGFEAFPSTTEFIANQDEWLRCAWRPPGWEWVDPVKEANASKIEVENGFRSRGDVIESAGGDLREVFAELAQEKALAESLGLKFGSAAEAEIEAQANEQQATAKVAAEDE